jgi:hypothetical protein
MFVVSNFCKCFIFRWRILSSSPASGLFRDASTLEIFVKGMVRDSSVVVLAKSSPRFLLSLLWCTTLLLSMILFNFAASVSYTVSVSPSSSLCLCLSLYCLRNSSSFSSFALSSSSFCFLLFSYISLWAFCASSSILACLSNSCLRR